MFRLINQINLLVDPLNVTFNTIGRYYKDKLKVYRPMFKVLLSEITVVYDYMRRAINRIF